jgi:hypothetical protein
LLPPVPDRRLLGVDSRAHSGLVKAILAQHIEYLWLSQ